MPYISSFLPSKNKELWVNEDGVEEWPNEIPLNPDPSLNDIREAEEDLRELAKDLKWRVNNTMHTKMKWMGVTRLADTGDEPWRPLDYETVKAWDNKARARGKTRRPLIIGIMGEYVKALKESDPRSEEHLRAIFMTGITIAHEIGHATFHNDFRSFHPTGEPYVGDDCEAEMGFSFISWIFSGFHPQMSPNKVDFKKTLFWEPQYTLSMGKRPLDKTCYAIPIYYLEEKLSQKFWVDLGPPHQANFSARARKALRPDTDGKTRRIAIGKEPNWSYSYLRLRPQWNRSNGFRMPGYGERDKIVGLSSEEIEYEKERAKDTPANRRYAAMSREERERRVGLINIMIVGDYYDSEPELEEHFNRQRVKIKIEDEDSQSQDPWPEAWESPARESRHPPGNQREETAPMLPENPGLEGSGETVTEMVQDIAARGAALDGFVHRRDESGSGLPGRLNSGLSILEEVEDYEEEVEREEAAEDEAARRLASESHMLGDPEDTDDDDDEPSVDPETALRFAPELWIAENPEDYEEEMEREYEAAERTRSHMADMHDRVRDDEDFDDEDFNWGTSKTAEE
jgi:hypothetical protein